MTIHDRPAVPASPFAPITPMFLCPVDSDLYTFLDEAHHFIEEEPSLVEAVENDLDAHGLRKNFTAHLILIPPATTS